MHSIFRQLNALSLAELEQTKRDIQAVRDSHRVSELSVIPAVQQKLEEISESKRIRLNSEEMLQYVFPGILYDPITSLGSSITEAVDAIEQKEEIAHENILVALVVTQLQQGGLTAEQAEEAVKKLNLISEIIGLVDQRHQFAGLYARNAIMLYATLRSGLAVYRNEEAPLPAAEQAQCSSVVNKMLEHDASRQDPAVLPPVLPVLSQGIRDVMRPKQKMHSIF